MKVSKKAKLIKKVEKMEFNNPIIVTLIGLVVFYIGLKMFSGGMKSMGNLEHLNFFLGNPYYMFLRRYYHDIVMAILIPINYCNYCIGRIRSITAPICNSMCSRCQHRYNWNHTG